MSSRKKYFAPASEIYQSTSGLAIRSFITFLEVLKVEKKRLYIKALDLNFTEEKFGLYGEVTTI